MYTSVSDKMKIGCVQETQPTYYGLLIILIFSV